MNEIRNKLSTTIDKSVKERSYQQKRVNIDSFSEMDRNNLYYNKNERRILLHTTSAGEKIYIQFPGKEAARDGEKARPWDFRPKVISADGQLLEDLSFKDIWNDLTDISESGSDLLPILASIFTRMAYMIDHKLVTEDYSSGIITFNPDSFSETESVKIEWYKYCPPSGIIEYLQTNIGNIHGMSVEAYLFMNDLLAQNEDCKYFYRDYVLRGDKWDEKIGRKNNLLTHVAITGFLEKKIRFTDVMDQFQRMRGVAPILESRISDVTDGIITYIKK